MINYTFIYVLICDLNIKHILNLFIFVFPGKLKAGHHEGLLHSTASNTRFPEQLGSASLKGTKS